MKVVSKQGYGRCQNDKLFATFDGFSLWYSSAKRAATTFNQNGLGRPKSYSKDSGL